MGAIFTNIAEIFANSGWAQIFFAEGGWKYAVMIGVACVLLYLGIVKKFEPLLLVPIVALQTSCEKFSYNLQKRNGA